MFLSTNEKSQVNVHSSVVTLKVSGESPFKWKATGSSRLPRPKSIVGHKFLVKVGWFVGKNDEDRS